MTVLRTNFFKPVILILTTILFLTLVTPSVSANNAEFSPEEQKEINKISENLRFYFEEVGELTENGYVVKNAALLQERIAAKDSTAIMIYEFFQLGPKPAFQTLGVTDFAKCIVNKLVGSYGSIARQFLNGAIYTYIKSKQYDLAAKLIANVLVKAGFKVNAAGIAAEVGMYAWQCRGEL